MKLGELLELLKDHDEDCEVYVATAVELGSGPAAIVNDTNMFVTKVSNSVIIHSNNPKKPLDHGRKGVVITSVD